MVPRFITRTCCSPTRLTVSDRRGTCTLNTSTPRTKLSILSTYSYHSEPLGSWTANSVVLRVLWEVHERDVRSELEGWFRQGQAWRWCAAVVSRTRTWKYLVFRNVVIIPQWLMISWFMTSWSLQTNCDVDRIYWSTSIATSGML